MTATRGDVLELSKLIEEIEVHYGATTIPADAERAVMIDRLLFGDLLVARVLLVRDGDRAVGRGAYSYLWPAAAAEHAMFPKELFVRPRDRSRGVAGVLICRMEV